MAKIDIRQLRRQAAELLRRAEAGETITITIGGREAAELGPVRRTSWRSGADLTAIFSGPADQQWAADRDTLHDPRC
jgi:prevent-host-death family protein